MPFILFSLPVNSAGNAGGQLRAGARGGELGPPHHPAAGRGLLHGLENPHGWQSLGRAHGAVVGCPQSLNHPKSVRGHWTSTMKTKHVNADVQMPSCKGLHHTPFFYMDFFFNARLNVMLLLL